MWYKLAKFEFVEGFDTKVVSEKNKGDYTLRNMKVKHPADDTPPVNLDSCYSNKDHCYIGDEKTAKMLKKKGILPELADPENKVCSIGFCYDEKKWYGWSHRAMKGFGIGDIAEEWYPDGADKGKKPAKTLDDAKEMAKAFAESVS